MKELSDIVSNFRQFARDGGIATTGSATIVPEDVETLLDELRIAKLRADGAIPGAVSPEDQLGRRVLALRAAIDYAEATNASFDINELMASCEAVYDWLTMI